MNGAFYIGATGLDAEQRALDVVANNITNVNTPGFKRSESRFSALVAPPSRMNRLAPYVSNSTAQLLGVSVDASPLVFTQGAMQQTGQPLDVAINGEGFIEVLGAGGRTELWRGGTLTVNADGFLSASNGLPLKAMISVPIDATSVTVATDGSVQAVAGSSANPSTIGQIDLVRPKDMSTLSPLDDGMYQLQNDNDVTSSAPGVDGAGVLVPGSIEGSNVQLTDEMVNLMLLQRAYASNAEVVQAGDQLMATANSLRR